MSPTNEPHEPTMILQNPLETGREIVARAAASGFRVRLIGGVAVALHSPSAADEPFRRDYEDIDLVVGSRDRKGLDALLKDFGFLPDVAFNGTHGKERRCYDHADGAGKVDVFIGEFSMCHTLPLEERLPADEPTVPLAELVLSKAQIFELNDKDAHDLLAVLLDHPIGRTDDDEINATRLGEICGADWGLWRTTQRSLDTLTETIDRLAVPEESRHLLRGRVNDLRQVLDDAPKNRKWKMRARIGERVRWYELPEDPDRGD